MYVFYTQEKTFKSHIIWVPYYELVFNYFFWVKNIIVCECVRILFKRMNFIFEESNKHIVHITFWKLCIFSENSVDSDQLASDQPIKLSKIYMVLRSRNSQPIKYIQNNHDFGE